MRSSKNRMTKRQAKAKYETVSKAANRAMKDFLLIEKAGLSRKSLIYKAAHREIDRLADEQIAAQAVWNAIGTDLEEAELRYQELWKRLSVLNALLGSVASAGFLPDSSLWSAVDREIEAIGAALNEAEVERGAIMRSKL